MPNHALTNFILAWFLLAPAVYADNPRILDEAVRLPWGYGCIPASSAFNNDHELSKELMHAWYERDARLKEDLDLKVQMLATAELPSSAPMQCKISYIATKDGKLLDVAFAQHSNNPCFDLICLSAVRSLQDNPICKFPEQTRYGRSYDMAGFKYSGTHSNEVVNSPKLSEEELQTLMKLSLQQIQDILRLSPKELHRKLNTWPPTQPSLDSLIKDIPDK